MTPETSSRTSTGSPGPPGRASRPDTADPWNEAWRHDEFVLDPTRVTLYIGKTGLSGYEFREHVLMQRFGIQINKTSINSVLLIFTIGVTWSSVNFLLDALRRAAETLDRERAVASNAERRLLERRTRALTSDLPGLPDFSEFDSAFRSTPTSPDGDIRAAFYAVYDDADREYIPLRQAVGLLSSGRRLVSTSFVVPYPPGFPVLVPGQSVSPAIVDFLTKLDVKEIHGYRPEIGLSVFTQDALDRRTAAAGDRDRNHPVNGRPSDLACEGRLPELVQKSSHNSRRVPRTRSPAATGYPVSSHAARAIPLPFAGLATRVNRSWVSVLCRNACTVSASAPFATRSLARRCALASATPGLLCEHLQQELPGRGTALPAARR